MAEKQCVHYYILCIFNGLVYPWIIPLYAHMYTINNTAMNLSGFLDFLADEAYFLVTVLVTVYRFYVKVCFARSVSHECSIRGINFLWYMILIFYANFLT